MSVKRFYISPDGERVRWMEQHVKSATHPDWLDATDWPDEKLAAFPGASRNQESSHDNQ